MELKNEEGQSLMIDDPAFESVFEYLQNNKIPLLGYLDEPLNYWIPTEEMTFGNDCIYFK